MVVDNECALVNRHAKGKGRVGLELPRAGRVYRFGKVGNSVDIWYHGISG